MITPLVYLNGNWIPSHELSIPVEDMGFLMGVSVVERLRTLGGRIFRQDDHMGRLHRSLECVGWDADAICPEVENAIASFLSKNADLFSPGDDWNIVCFVTPGTSAIGSNPTVGVHGFPIPFHHWSDQYKNGVAAAIVSTRQIPENCWPAELKCRSRMHYYLADKQAQAAFPGARGILLDQAGYVGEGTTANVVGYFAGRGLVTPHRCKVLPGVSQLVAFELAESLGLSCQEDNLLPDELAQADEILFTSTSICLLPVTQLDGQPVGSGKPGPVFQQLLSAWSELSGVDIAAQAQEFSHR